MLVLKTEFKGGGRFKIYIDEFVLELDDETVYKAGIKSGTEINEENFEKLSRASEIFRAKRCISAMLSASLQTRAMLSIKLIRKGFTDAETRNRALDFFEKQGLIDDRVFAESWAKDAAAFKKFGKSRIYAELLKKGVASDIAAAAAENLPETNALKSLAEKELSKIAEKDEKSLNKIRRKLFSKGYGIGNINSVLEELLTDD